MNLMCVKVPTGSRCEIDCANDGTDGLLPNPAIFEGLTMETYIANEAGAKGVQHGLDSGDLGLRQYMLRVYNYMAGGLALTV
jgi:hypothetical protein